MVPEGIFLVLIFFRTGSVVGYMGSELWKLQEFSSTAQKWYKLFSDIAIRVSSLDGEFHNQT